MINFDKITTLLFDIDNTLIMFDEDAFVPIYGKYIHNYFLQEIPSYEEFMKLFLHSTHSMLKKEPIGLTNLEKFALDFSNVINLPPNIITERFLQFYNKEFDNLAVVVSAAPLARSLLQLTTQHFNLVAATNPLFPDIATQKRLQWGGIESPNIPWLEVTVADVYSTAKPHLEYYLELLQKIDKTPEECLMIGNDKINDMIAGKLGIKTFLVRNNSSDHKKIITTELDQQYPDFPIDASGTLEDLYQIIHNFIKNKNRSVNRNPSV